MYQVQSSDWEAKAWLDEHQSKVLINRNNYVVRERRLMNRKKKS
jgi:hypothetical protein